MAKVEILGCRVDAVDMAAAKEKVLQFISFRKPHQIVTVNAEILYRASRYQPLKDVINNAALVTPDGAGAVWAARYLGHPVPERVAGIDLMMELLKEAAASGYRVFFLGAAPGVAEAAADKAKELFQGLAVVGCHDGYFEEQEEDRVIDEIKKVKPDMLFVALGSPRQELWISKHLSKLNVPVAMGVGGSFDVLAGKVKRAPEWMQRANLEWLGRLMMQPSRFGRMLALPKFVFAVIKSKK